MKYENYSMNKTYTIVEWGEWSEWSKIDSTLPKYVNSEPIEPVIQESPRPNDEDVVSYVAYLNGQALSMTTINTSFSGDYYF